MGFSPFGGRARRRRRSRIGRGAAGGCGQHEHVTEWEAVTFAGKIAGPGLIEGLTFREAKPRRRAIGGDSLRGRGGSSIPDRGVRGNDDTTSKYRGISYLARRGRPKWTRVQRRAIRRLVDSKLFETLR